MAAGKLRGLVATASLDLGVDWGDVDCVIQMGAPKGSSRLLRRIGRANHRLDEPSEAILIPGNRFEYLKARAALDAVEAGARDPDIFRPGGLDVLAQHIMAVASAALETDLDLTGGAGGNLQLQRLAIHLLIAEKLVAVGFTFRQLRLLRLGKTVEFESLLIQVVAVGDLPEQLGFTGVQAFGGKHKGLFHR